jgi:hypothetical protein
MSLTYQATEDRFLDVAAADGALAGGGGTVLSDEVATSAGGTIVFAL